MAEATANTAAGPATAGVTTGTAGLSQVRTQLIAFFRSLSTARKLVLGSVLLTVLLGVVLLVVLSSQERWTPLYSNISHEDAALIKEKLDANQIPVQIGPGGTSLLVPTALADEARITLAQSRVSLGGGLGFADLFVEKGSLGETEFQQQVKYRIALEGELGRLISQIENIQSAKVTLALPKQSLFLEEETPPSASVVVVPATGQELQRGHVLTITHLVANAVERLQKESVAVVDSHGRLLTRFLNDGEVGAGISEQFALKRHLEGVMEAKIVNQLEPVIGEGRVRARVSADLAFDRVETAEEIYDPDGSVLRSEQRSEETSSGSRSIPVGIPGVTSNLPENAAGTQEAANVSQLSRATQTRNFETSVRRVTSQPAPGKLQRISVSVLIDGKYKPIINDDGVIVTRQYEEWTLEEKQELERLVQAAVGFDEKRGDTLEIVNLRFSEAVEEAVTLKRQQTERNREFFLDILRYTFLGVGILALVMFVIRPLVQRLSARPEDMDLLLGLPTTFGELEDDELEVPSDHKEELPDREEILHLARSDPLSTAALLRSWLHERR